MAIYVGAEDAHPTRDWLDAHRHWCMPMLRMFIGALLLWKGLGFMFDRAQLLTVMLGSGVPFASAALAHVVILFHVAGGSMLLLGVGTRIAALLQVPIVLGALVFVHLGGRTFAGAAGLQLSVTVLFALLLLAWHGAGAFSLDEARED